jgi:hypothetical protein
VSGDDVVRPPGPESAGSVRTPWRRTPWYALTLLPRSVVTTVRAVTTARAVTTPRDVGRGRRREVLIGMLGVGLGVWAWFVAFLVAVGFARGPLYGLVVPGPYDDAWGGPSLAGAWAVHAAVWVGVAVVALGMWWAVVALSDRVGAHLRGERRAAWSVSVASVLLAAAAVFVWLWSRQV